jgi:hypothetical protein
MCLHSLVYHTKLCGQSFNVVLNVCLQAFEIDAVLMQCVQDLFFLGITWRFVLGLGLFAKAVEVLGELPKILASHIGHRLECGGLEVFKTGMIEKFAN